MLSLLQLFGITLRFKRGFIASLFIVILVSISLTSIGGNSLVSLKLNFNISYNNTFSLGEFVTDYKDTLPQNTTKTIKEIVYRSEQLWYTDKEQSEKLLLGVFDTSDQEYINDSVKARIYHLYGKLLIDKRETGAGIDTLLRCVEIKKRVFGGKNSVLPLMS